LFVITISFKLDLLQSSLDPLTLVARGRRSLFKTEAQAKSGKG